jgi:hypothetical protein
VRRVCLAALLAPLAVPTAGAQAAAPGGQLFIALRHVHGHPALAFTGQSLAVHGTVVPYVPGQRVDVSFYLGRRRLASRRVMVAAAGTGVGRFRIAFSTPHSGSVTVRAVHAATAAQGGFAARPRSVRFIAPHLSGGARGEAVRLLQSELARLHYAVPQSGYFDDATGRAVIAYRKMIGQARIATTDTHVFEALARGQGGFHVRYPRDGKHVEADLTRQVLAEIDRSGHVRRIYTMSSGKPSTPTVVGRFRVYLKDLGVNSEGMVDSNYFIRGYAIHGYADVPTYAASHGCLRIPIPDAPAVFAWVSVGDPVDVYDEGGGGSHNVNANAGP